MKFTYENKEYVLEDIVGSANLFKIEGAVGNQIGITKDGITKLQHAFPQILVEFGSIQRVTLEDVDILALQATASNENGNTPVVSSFGEMSKLNIKKLWITYPISILEARAYNRVLLKALGITSVISEEELSSMSDKLAENVDGNLTVEGLVKQIREAGDKKGLSDTQRLNVYREILGDMTLTSNQIMEKLTIDTAKQVLCAIEKEIK